ncbi:ATP-binding protein [Sphingopyxis sp. JAI128]|uniref:PAS domain-containing sensor histidine kinase n=1 Tax=Sphingopyxis sp. JAI128 TaxID=2723066 RepID=UPI0016220FE3|nr:ATP-binding protein [Sphingopyxis sp. JAI128]MBB6426092.1 signal transduction histidine kinase [Sphingopyxis sp. JAI128]
MTAAASDEPAPSAPTEPLYVASRASEPDIADFASESVIIFDVEGAIQYWNPASEALYGWPAITMIGRGIAHLTTRSENEREHWRLLLQEGTWQGVVSRRMPSGIHVVVDIRQYVRFAQDGTPRDVIEYGRQSPGDNSIDSAGWHIPDRLMAAGWEVDVSGAEGLIAEIAQLRQDADADEKLLHARHVELVEAARIVNVNERTMRLVGGNRGRDLMIGQPVAGFWPLESRMVAGQLFADAMLGKVDGAAYRRQMPSDGILRDPLVTVWRAEKPGRLYVAVNGTVDDDRSYIYLRASEARYRKLVHHMPVALWQVDASHMGRIYNDVRATGVTDFDAYLDEHPELVDLAATTVQVTDVNRAAVQMLGGSGPLDLMRPVGYLFTIARDSLRNVMIGRFKGQESHHEVTKIETFDGRVRDVRMSVTYPKQVAELDVTIFSFEDVTEHMSIEAELRQLQADFTHAARISTLGELTTSIAHEVNQPLAAIVTNAETSLRWLSRADLNIQKLRELTTRIAASGRRASDIVQRIRGMAAKRQPERVAIDLNDVAQESLLFVRHEIESRSIRITTDFARDLPRAVGDRIQLQQVIVNLLVNGVQAVEERGEGERQLFLRTGDESGQLILTLRDTGSGIPPDDVERIFQGFFTTKENGMGIGLAICQSIVAEHGGSISACNHPDGGAEFRFAIPIGPA